MDKADWAVSMPGTFPLARAMQAAYRTLFSIYREDLKAAADWGIRLEQHLSVLPLHYHHIRGRLMIAQGKKKEATALLQDLYTKWAGVDAFGVMISVLVYLALAAENQQQALGFLAEALKLGEPRGYIRSFIDERKLLKPLLLRAQSQGVSPGYTRKLLDTIDAEERQRQLSRRAAVSGRTADTLSEREVEILRLLAVGLSNRQLAEKLIISVGTAKTHVHNIFEKLDARTRTEAVARARDLKLI